MEILASAALLAGMGADDARSILGCGTTDGALDIIFERNMADPVLKILIDKIKTNMNGRVNGTTETGAIVFSSKYGKLCGTGNADELVKKLGDMQ
jgi:cobalt-precorrin-5B (C1)-methyltransferase